MSKAAKKQLSSPITVPRVRVGRNMYYTIQVAELALGGKRITTAGMDSGQGTLLDSGTTFTYLPRGVARAFHAELRKWAQLKGYPDFDSKGSYDFCFQSCAAFCSASFLPSS